MMLCYLLIVDKPSKSRLMVLRKGKVIDKFCFSISGTVISSNTKQPVKSLGKHFDSGIRDSAATQKSNEELGAWVTKVDKSVLSGRFKAWIYQHFILPQILWPLLIYAVPVTTDQLSRSMAFSRSGWAFPAASPAHLWDTLMGRVTFCSYRSVASLESSWWLAPEKPSSTGTVRCHQLALR